MLRPKGSKDWASPDAFGGLLKSNRQQVNKIAGICTETPPRSVLTSHGTTLDTLSLVPALHTHTFLLITMPEQTV